MNPEERLQELVSLGLPEELARLQVEREFGTVPGSSPAQPATPIEAATPTPTPTPAPDSPGLFDRLKTGAMEAPMLPGGISLSRIFGGGAEPEPAAPPSTGPTTEELPADLQALLANFGQGTGTEQPLEGTPGIDPFTGGATDIPGFMRFLSSDREGRKSLFDESFINAPNLQKDVYDFARSRFDPLDAQYVAQGVVDPAGGPDFRQYMSENPQALGGDDWKTLFAAISGLASSVGSPDDLMSLGATAGAGGPQAAAYNTLRESGGDILGAAIGANIHPALAQAASRELGRRLLEYGSAAAGAPSNQAEFVRQEAPLWRSILGIG